MFKKIIGIIKGWIKALVGVPEDTETYQITEDYSDTDYSATYVESGDWTHGEPPMSIAIASSYACCEGVQLEERVFEQPEIPDYNPRMDKLMVPRGPFKIDYRNHRRNCNRVHRRRNE